MARLTLIYTLVLAFVSEAGAQVPFPDYTVQDVTWTNDIHDVSVTQPILSPGNVLLPVSITGTADAEFVSATSVRLSEGFHAGGFSNNGRFRAHIAEGMANSNATIVISPDPVTHVIDNMLHVSKWEKLELGFELPQEYTDAITGFFGHYYSNLPIDGTATSSLVDPAHDLNPYADDSLQLVMTLTKPNGDQTMKWGFYMREGMWSDDSPSARLEENIANVLHPYHVRFRCAPDQEGLWQFSLSLKAPHTTTLASEQLSPLLQTGFSFVCDPPESDNKGYLRVNENNRRTLEFEDGTAFFGLGTNMADNNGSANYVFRKREFDQMQETMQQLSAVDGNFLRMFLMRFLFAPEWVNLGVYDHYQATDPCNNYQGMDTIVENCQYQCWAFDQMLDRARENDIYLQLCIDPYVAGTDYETFQWGPHPYVINFLETERDPITGRFDVKKLFYQDGDPVNKDSGVFYYWKRKYKYIMSRWGYSVNIAAIEPFNETDQMLTYRSVNLTGTTNAICPENKLNWLEDPLLPTTLDNWITDITTFVRGTVDFDNPVTSPLGEDRKLFLMSYVGAEPANTSNTNYYLPFINPNVDLIDVHMGLYGGHHAMRVGFDNAQAYRDNFQSVDDQGQLYKKPFHQGEFNYYALVDRNPDPLVITDFDTGKIFSNYDVSFHNELWASTFFGNFAAGTTWLYDRVFWWENALPTPPTDFQNSFHPFGVPFSRVLGATNNLDIGIPDTPIPITNRRLQHHFQPLAQFISNPNLEAFGLFNGIHTAHKVYDFDNKIECYYLLNEQHDLAIGWVHNLNAYWENNYYRRKSDENFLDCATPNAQSVSIQDLLPGTDYYISYFPTRMNTTICPADGLDDSQTGLVTLDLSSAPLNGLFPSTGEFKNHMDTLHADHAFIIATSQVKSLTTRTSPISATATKDWDFTLYPNPARDELFLRFQDDLPKHVMLHDLSGRTIRAWSSVSGPIKHLPLGALAKGAYWVRVSDGLNNKTKKLIIH